ncbi:extensin-like domain-containing protein [Tropicimonas marinistellae]|uniref:extensin-like domain-containing protein n=1 Tax=Tropicimonas marinistellae TaxID=1739787 RepID=UPI000AD547FD|nr:extensin family protein [Tropicimonas marinistellae]
MTRLVCAGAVLLFTVVSTAADVPESSLRPEPRPTEAATAATDPGAPHRPDTVASGAFDVAETAGTGRVNPRPRPRAGVFSTAVTPADSLAQVSRQVTRVHYGVPGTLAPLPRPPHPLYGLAHPAAVVAVPMPQGAPHPKVRPAGFAKLFQRRDSFSRTGSVCGVNGIKGATRATIGRPSSGCGISNPVKVTSVSGVRLSTPATIDCTTAKALNAWVVQALKPAVGRRGGGPDEIKLAASYACRSRNNVPGGKLSEHARGHAVDISGFSLKDGTDVTVLSNWRSKDWGGTLKKLHAAACGPFGTVLGPNADRYHQDHFHFDTARYRSGHYCR